MKLKRVAFVLLVAFAAAIGGPAFGGLAHYWTFDADATDAVSGGRDGTFVGAGATITDVEGEFQRGTGALKISHDTATGDYVRISGAVLPTYNPTAFAITAWFKWDETLGTQPTDDRCFLWETTPYYTSAAGVDAQRQIQWYLEGSDTSISQENQSPPISDGLWHHIAIVYDNPGGTVDYYLDGNNLNTVPANILRQPTTGMNIGNPLAGDGSRNWKGYIDDFAVYNGTIDLAGVQGLYYGTLTPQNVPVTEGPDPPPPPPTGRPVAYWTFDNDYSSAVNNSIYEGTPQGGAYTSITKVAGEFKRGTGALKLDSGPSSGNGTYVDIGKEVAFIERDKQITVSAWYNYTDISGDGSDLQNHVWESSPGYSLSFRLGTESGVKDCEWFYQWTSGSTSDGSGPIVTPGAWNHVVMVLDEDAGRIQFYHNGKLFNDVPSSGLTIAAMDGFHIGNHRTGDGARDFDGYIDDMAVYHGVMTAEAVADLYAGTKTPLTVAVGDSLAPFVYGEVVEDGWSLKRTIDFTNVSSVAYSSVDGKIYVGKRPTTAGTGSVYSIDSSNNVALVASVDRPAGILIDPGDGDIFVSEDNAGVIRRIGSGGSTAESWVTGFNTGDDDPVGMAMVPDTYTGSLVNPGSIISVDRGSGGYEEVWVWSPDTAEGEVTLVADSDVADGVGNVFIDLADVAVSDTDIFVADAGASKIYRITDTDTVEELVTSEAILQPRSLVIDPTTDDLLVLGVLGGSELRKLFRVDTTTGDVSVVIDHIGYGTTWANLAITPDGRSLFVADYLLNQVFEFALAGQTFGLGDANGDGTVDDKDASILGAHWMQPGVWGDGDFNNDNVVNDADAAILAAHWGEGVPPTEAPEPTTAILLVGVLATVGLLRTRRFPGEPHRPTLVRPE